MYSWTVNTEFEGHEDYSVDAIEYGSCLRFVNDNGNHNVKV